MNNTNLLGRLTSDPELKTTPNGVNVCSFRVAVNRPGVKDKTDFIPCVAWRQTADFVCRYFSKGKMIALSGVLTSRDYEDKDGQKHTAYEVVADRVFFAGDSSGSKRDDQPRATIEPQPYASGDFTILDDSEDTPF